MCSHWALTFLLALGAVPTLRASDSPPPPRLSPWPVTTGAATLARAFRECEAKTLAPARNASAAATALFSLPPTDPAADVALSLLACAVRSGDSVLPLSRGDASAALLHACMRKSASLVAALLQREGGVDLGASEIGATLEPPSTPPRTPGWTPLHAALSTRLLTLSLAQDAIRERPATPLASSVEGYRAGLRKLVGALLRHAPAHGSSARALAAAMRDMRLSEGNATDSSVEVAADGSGATSRSAAATTLVTVKAESLNAIANALALQLARMLLLAAAGGASSAQLATAVDDYGQSPLHVAASMGNEEAIGLLLSAVAHGGGGDAAAAAAVSSFISATDANGNTALDLACAGGHASTAAALWASSSPVHRDVPPCPQVTPSTIQGAAEGTGRRLPLAWDDSIPPPPHSSTAARALAAVVPLLSQPCAIDTVLASELTSERFVTRNYLRSRPLLVTGDSAVDARVHALFERDALLARAGDIPFTPSAIPYASSFWLNNSNNAGKSKPVSLRDYVAFMRNCSSNGASSPACAAFAGGAASRGAPYVFASPASAHAAASGVDLLLDGIEPYDLIPHWMRDARVSRCSADGACATGNVSVPVVPAAAKNATRPQFYVGSGGTGAPWHFHKDAINLLTHGSKLWSLRRPAVARYSTQPVAELVLANDDDGDVEHCVQRAGEAMFVPAGWGHAVLNIETVVGVALEFTTALQTSV